MRSAYEAQPGLGLEAVVSLLDEEHDAKVRALWAELEREFGLQGIYGAPYPHISYHGAREYPDAQVKSLLEKLAPKVSPFCIRTAGLGIFTGERPVLYVPVNRNRQLATYFEMLFPSLTALARNENRHYRAERWMPHITLAYGDLTHDVLPDVIRYLSERTYSWEIRIDNSALVYINEQEQGLKFRVPFAGQAETETV
ncbi:MAG TPA: 2'-5' RNA ligase family protein [Trueperaceae bacterium]